MTAALTQVQNAVLELLAPLKESGRVVALQPYTGQLTGVKTLDDVRKALGGAIPGVLVEITREKFHGIAVKRDRARRDVTITLYLADGHERSFEDRTRADGGIYELLDEIYKLITGAAIKPFLEETVSAGVLEVVGAEQMSHDPATCLWSVELVVTIEVVRAQPPAQPVTEFRTRTNLTDVDDTAGNPAITLSNPVEN